MEARYMTDLEWRICHAVNIYVFKNGNDQQTPILVHIPPSRKKTMQSVIDTVQERVTYPVGYAKTLFTMDGRRIRHPCELEMYNNYVVASNFEKSFKCVEYGRKRSPLLVLNRHSKHIRVLRLQNDNYDQWLKKKRETGSERPQYVFPERYIHEGVLPQDLPVDKMGNTYVPNCDVDPNEPNYAEKHDMHNPQLKRNQQKSYTVNAFTIEQDTIEEYLQHVDSDEIEDQGKQFKKLGQEQDKQFKKLGQGEDKQSKKLGQDQVFHQPQEKWRTKGVLEKHKDENLPLIPTASDVLNANPSAENVEHIEDTISIQRTKGVLESNKDLPLIPPPGYEIEDQEKQYKKLGQDQVFYQPQEKWRTKGVLEKNKNENLPLIPPPGYEMEDQEKQFKKLGQDQVFYQPQEKWRTNGVLENNKVENLPLIPPPGYEIEDQEKEFKKLGQDQVFYQPPEKWRTKGVLEKNENLPLIPPPGYEIEDQEKQFKKLGQDQVFYQPQEKWRTKGVLEKNKDENLPLFPTASHVLNTNSSTENEEEIEDIAEVEDNNDVEVIDEVEDDYDSDNNDLMTVTVSLQAKKSTPKKKKEKTVSFAQRKTVRKIGNYIQRVCSAVSSEIVHGEKSTKNVKNVKLVKMSKTSQCQRQEPVLKPLSKPRTPRSPRRQNLQKQYLERGVSAKIKDDHVPLKKSDGNSNPRYSSMNEKYTQTEND